MPVNFCTGYETFAELLVYLRSHNLHVLKYWNTTKIPMKNTGIPWISLLLIYHVAKRKYMGKKAPAKTYILKNELCQNYFAGMYNKICVSDLSIESCISKQIKGRSC